MKVAFTGHRNASTTDNMLEKIAEAYPGATWCHGGARGFDTQVEEFAAKRGITQEVIRPDYIHNGKAAPFIRNRQIVDGAVCLFACYDGREKGGTHYTVKYAMGKGLALSMSPSLANHDFRGAPKGPTLAMTRASKSALRDGGDQSARCSRACPRASNSALHWGQSSMCLWARVARSGSRRPVARS